VDVSLTHQRSKDFVPFVFRNAGPFEQIEGACSWSMPTEINATARPRFSSRAAHGSRRQDAERVQQSPTERSGAVVSGT